MTTLRIGVVGLGGIAQKHGCRFRRRVRLDAARGVVAHSRKQSASAKRRIPYAGSLEDLARECDAVFVHTSTATHFRGERVAERRRSRLR